MLSTKLIKLSFLSFLISNILFTIGIFVVNPEQEKLYTEGSLMVEGNLVFALGALVGLLMYIALIIYIGYLVAFRIKGGKYTKGDLLSLLVLVALPVLTQTALNTVYTMRI